MAEAMEAILLLVLGAVAGAVPTYLLTRKLEAEKWRRERAAKRQDEKRVAIQKALEWISPMTDAVNLAPLLAGRACSGTITRNEIQREWPKLRPTLVNLDLSAHHMTLLPDGIYRRGHNIVELLSRLESEAISAVSHVEAFGSPAPDAMLEACMSLAGQMSRQVLELQELLEKEYKATFE